MSLSKTEILQCSPWEHERFLSVPKGSDRWLVDVDEKWVCRTHGKLRKRGFHPFHSSFPLKDAALLHHSRVTIMFKEKQTSEMERVIMVDKFTDTDSDFWKKHSHQWKGFTFFLVDESAKVPGVPCTKPKEEADCDVVALISTAASEQCDTEDSFVVVS